MDSKYLGKNIALPKAAHERLAAVQEAISGQLGFTPSLSETLLYLIRQWEAANATKERAVPDGE